MPTAFFRGKACASTREATHSYGCPCGFWPAVSGMVFANPRYPFLEARMPTFTIDYQSDSERLVLEQAVAYVQSLNRLAQTAAHGTVLAVCEQLALDDGRKLLRDTLAAVLQTRADAVDAQKKTPATAAKAGTRAGT
jgi:hypothetical protein